LLRAETQKVAAYPCNAAFEYIADEHCDDKQHKECLGQLNSNIFGHYHPSINTSLSGFASIRFHLLVPQATSRLQPFGLDNDYQVPCNLMLVPSGSIQ
jgi:hypothetical protein